MASAHSSHVFAAAACSRVASLSDFRTPALVPGQVQLLRGLLAGREAEIATVILADERDGTYIPKATPKASGSTNP